MAGLNLHLRANMDDTMLNNMVIAATNRLKIFIDRRCAELSKELEEEFQPRTKATMWYRLSTTNPSGWEFNHLENGHCPNNVPTPKHPNHSNVWKGRWAKSLVQLNFGTEVAPFMIIS